MFVLRSIRGHSGTARSAVPGIQGRLRRIYRSGFRVRSLRSRPGMTLCITLALVIVAFVNVRTSLAQSDFPNRPVRIIVRHPMYSAFWLWALAQALLLPNWIAGPAGLVGFGTLFFLRIGREERLMEETFGDDYRRYVARTGRIVPRLF